MEQRAEYEPGEEADTGAEDRAALQRQAGLSLVLIIPLASLLVANAAAASLASTWTGFVTAEYGAAVATRPDASLAAVCAGADAVGSLCGILTVANLAQLAGLVGLLLGAVLILLIWAGAEWAQGDRVRLLAWFRPALYLTIVGTIVLAIVDGGALIGAVYSAMVVVLDVVWPGVLGVLAVVVVVVVVGIASSLGRTARIESVPVMGVPIRPGEQDRLWAFVCDVARELAADEPDTIVLGLDPTFFVTEAAVVTPYGSTNGRTLFLSLPLAAVLSREELAAVVAHELAHFRGEDTTWSRRFFPIYRASVRSLAATHGVGGWTSVPAIPARSVLAYFVERFGTNEREISRIREFAADGAAEEMSRSRQLATALCKLSLVEGAWSEAVVVATEGARSGDVGGSLIGGFVAHVRTTRHRAAVDGSHDAQAGHPFDTHPPLEERVAALGESLSSASAGITFEPAASGIAVVDDIAALEAPLDEMLLGVVRRQFAQRQADLARAQEFDAFTSDFESKFGDGKDIRKRSREWRNADGSTTSDE